MRNRHRARSFPSLVAAAGGVFVALGLPTRSQAQADARDLARADSLYAAQAWDQAVEAYAAIVPGRPQDGLCWYRYGTALLQSGRVAEAIPALEHSESIGHNPQVMYNLACALVREGRNDAALDWLLKATAAGFSGKQLLESDADLAPLRSRARWADVMAAAERSAHPCAFDDRHRQLDFWIGEWDVVTAGNQPAGESRVENILGTCVIFENWTGFQGMSGKSFNFIDPATNGWKQTWVTDKGGVHEYVGEFAGKAMCYRRETQDPAGKKTLHKMTLFDLEPGHVRQLGESSTDGGRTWTTQYDLHYHRKAKPAD